MGGIYFWTDLEHICPGHSCPTHFAQVQWCNCSNKAFNLKKRSVFAITSILSSQVCCQIAANAYMAREPDKKQKQIKSLSHFNIKSKYCSWGFVTIGFEHWMLCTSGHWCINMTVNQIKNGGNQTQQSRDSLIDAIVLVVSMILVSVTWHIQHL